MYLIYRPKALSYPLTEINFTFSKTLVQLKAKKSFQLFNYLTNQEELLTVNLKTIVIH